MPCWWCLARSRSTSVSSASLEAVPIPQKTRDHRPQTKLIQFLIGILAGLDYLQDFNAGACPLGADVAVMASWGQAAFAHYSGISRTLAAADATTLQAVIAALPQVSQPFLARDVVQILRSGQPLVVDIDLTGRPVSPTSTDYPDAAFGWMDAAVAKGYQAAISSLSGGPQGRVLLNSQRYGGAPSRRSACARRWKPSSKLSACARAAAPRWCRPRWRPCTPVSRTPSSVWRCCGISSRS